MMHRLQSNNVRLAPEDEYTHPVEAAENFSESVYFNLFDHRQRIGGWFRVGNRPNEGHAEMSVCLYLPEGRAGFMFERPAKRDNERFQAGGLEIEIREPFRKVSLSYNGKLCLMDNPRSMANPRKAFAENPIVECGVQLDFDGIAPMYGGEILNDDGTPIELDPESSFGRAHFEQHVAGDGFLKVNGQEWRIDGYGLRDHSWGPRYWQAVHFYRWLPMNFGRDFGMMIMQVGKADGSVGTIGMVLRDGGYTFIEDAVIESEWDTFFNQTGMNVRVKTLEREYDVQGKVLTLVPLRNRRKNTDGEPLLTRIAEGMTEFRCQGRTGYGMSEYLDQIVGGKPVGADI
jgi:hypothetical protein